MFFKYPKEINKKDFNPLKKDPNVFYGLPKEVKYCKKCTESTFQIAIAKATTGV